MPQVHRQAREADQGDSQRAEEIASRTDAQQRLEKLLEAQSRGPTIQPEDPRSQVTSLQQTVNKLQAERDVLAQELHQARKSVADDIQPVASFGDSRGPILSMPHHVPNDVMLWLQDRQADCQQALLQRDLMLVTELGKSIPEWVTHLSEITTIQPSSVGNMVTT